MKHKASEDYMTTSKKTTAKELTKGKTPPAKPKAKQSTSGNTTVAPKAKSSEKAVQKATEVSQGDTKGSPVKVASKTPTPKPKVVTPKPTIKGLQQEILTWKETNIKLNEENRDLLSSKTGVITRLSKEIEILNAALDEEVNKSWWEITKERFVESLYRVFGRFTSYE